MSHLLRGKPESSLRALRATLPLARDRPLGAARLLWEIGVDGRDVRSLRGQLDLDSGYLSRLLRSLEAAGLVTVDRAEDDRRVRIARLTAAGSAERDVLEQRSDELAASLLQPLSARQCIDLVRAMADVERLMTAAMVEVAPIDPDHPHAQHCLEAYFSDLDRRFDTGFDPSRSIPADAEEMRPPAGLFLVASLRGEPIGCGALKFHDNEPADLKRMSQKALTGRLHLPADLRVNPLFGFQRGLVA